MHPTTTDVPSSRTDRTPKELDESQGFTSQGNWQGHYSQRHRKNKSRHLRSTKVRRNPHSPRAIGYTSQRRISLPMKGSKKLSDLRTGPFEIIGKVGEGAYKLKLPEHMKSTRLLMSPSLTRATTRPYIDGRAPSEPAPVISGRDMRNTP
jgi:hypothetical protein